MKKNSDLTNSFVETVLKLPGWVPHAVAKRVSLCRVAADWPEEGRPQLDDESFFHHDLLFLAFKGRGIQESEAIIN